MAAYLGRGVRWCQRWREEECRPPLPLLVVRGRVEALEDDLDAWVRQLVDSSKVTLRPDSSVSSPP